MTERGYTLLELLIAISISSMLLLAIDKFVVNSIQSENQSYNKTLVLADAKTAVGVVANEVMQAVSVESANTQPDANAPGAPSNLYSWSGAAGDGANLILAVPSHDSNGNVIYVDSLHTQIYTDDVVFYLNSSTHKLYKRYVANSTAPGNAAKTTCPPASAGPSCPADALVVDDVADLKTNYLDSNNNSVSLPSGTEAVQYTVTETRNINGKTIAGTYTTVAAMRNK